MLIRILAHTPAWVFALFALLVWLGARQLRPNRVSLVRAALLPIAMIGLSLYGLVSAFGGRPLALAGWAAGAALTVAAMPQRPPPPGTRYEAARRTFVQAGSAVPLGLMMGIFFTKYAVGVFMTLRPGLAHDAGFSLAIGTFYGAINGTLARRTLRLWGLAERAGVTPTQAPRQAGPTAESFAAERGPAR